MYRVDCSSPGISVDSVFKQVYEALEKLQHDKGQTASITASIVNCARELRNLERIHGLRWKFYGPNSSEDPFDVHDMLKKFVNSCNAFSYVSSSSFEFDDEDLPDGCYALFPPKKNWKRKHFKALDVDFYEHQRILSLALANTVYTTTIRMQRTGTSPDSVITQVLAQSGRRQYRLARLPSRTKGNDKSVESGLEEMDWELCLRSYFEYVESWLPGSSVYASSTGGRSSYPQAAVFTTMKRSSSVGSNISDLKGEDEVDTSIFYRKPRRRGSLSSRASSDDDNDKRTMSLRSTSNNALVPYTPTSPVSPTITTVAHPRLIRRTSITSDFHWEYVGKSSTFSTLAPLTSRWPELKDAQVDIYTQTQNMTASEARAYAQGRLAGLSPEIIREVRQILSLPEKPRSTKLIHNGFEDNNCRRNSSSPQAYPTNLTTSKPPPNRDYISRRPVGSSNLSQTASAIAPLAKQRPVIALSPAAIPQSARKQQRSFEPAPRLVPQSKPRGTWKHPFTALAEMRPLTAISERPSTSRTTRSKTSSFDRPASRASLVTSFRRKSTLSHQVLPALPDTEIPGRSSGGSDETVVEKALPLPPKSRRQRLMAVFKRDEDDTEKEDYLADLPLSMPPSMLSLTRDRKASSESLRRVSMELLKRKDSKVALLAVAEGLELPFDLWLKALPYIEGVRNGLD